MLSYDKLKIWKDHVSSVGPKSFFRSQPAETGKAISPAQAQMANIVFGVTTSQLASELVKHPALAKQKNIIAQMAGRLGELATELQDLRQKIIAIEKVMETEEIENKAWLRGNVSRQTFEAMTSPLFGPNAQTDHKRVEAPKPDPNTHQLPKKIDFNFDDFFYGKQDKTRN